MVIESMSHKTFTEYYNAMGVINAQEMLNASSVASYPHSKDEYRKKFYSSVKRAANNYLKFDNDLPNMSQIMANLKRSING